MFELLCECGAGGLTLQSRYELDVARHNHLPEKIAQQVRPRSAA